MMLCKRESGCLCTRLYSAYDLTDAGKFIKFRQRNIGVTGIQRAKHAVAELFEEALAVPDEDTEFTDLKMRLPSDEKDVIVFETRLHTVTADTESKIRRIGDARRAQLDRIGSISVQDRTAACRHGKKIKRKQDLPVLCLGEREKRCRRLLPATFRFLFGEKKNDLLRVVIGAAIGIDKHLLLACQTFADGTVTAKLIKRHRHRLSKLESNRKLRFLNST